MKKTILIVEDEPSIVVTLEFLLEHNGYEVRIARDGQEALAVGGGRVTFVACYA